MMLTLKKNYDRVFALLVAILTLAVSTLLIVKSFGVSSRFHVAEVEPPGKPIPTIPDTGQMIAHTEAVSIWESPKALDSEKPLRAFVSTPMFWVDGELMCPFDSPPFRGEVPNAWLMKHGLPIERTDVLSLDPDEDGFSNGEEFANGDTDPNDAASHPDVVLKLSFADVVSEDFELLFASSAGGKASIRKMGGGRGWFEVGAVLPGKRHKLVGLDGALATIVDLESGEQSVLERRVKKNFPIYRAVFDYALDKALLESEVFALGESFSIPQGGGVCTVEALDLKSVKLSVQKPDGRLTNLVLGL